MQSIAIDGPAGAGKSTIAKAVAEKLGFTYVDTGALYRALAVFFLRQGLSPEDTAGVETACAQAHIDIAYENGTQQMYLNGENITARLRDGDVSRMASVSSALPAVRAHLLSLQRNLAHTRHVVMDGRDIGTTILPDATLKIFLTADVKERALRRYKQLQDSGKCADLAAIEEEIRARDHRDATRKISPLLKAADAVLLDSTALTPAAVTEKILSLYRERAGHSA